MLLHVVLSVSRSGIDGLALRCSSHANVHSQDTATQLIGDVRLARVPARGSDGGILINRKLIVRSCLWRLRTCCHGRKERTNELATACFTYATAKKTTVPTGFSECRKEGAVDVGGNVERTMEPRGGCIVAVPVITTRQANSFHFFFSFSPFPQQQVHQSGSA